MPLASKRKRDSDSSRSNRTPPRRPADTYLQPDTETESSLQAPMLFPSPSQHTRERVNVAAPDRRCLIENVPSMQGVQYAHYFPKNLGHEEMLTSLEYLWGMRYQSLNLDSRYNVFRVGASLLGMFDNDMWMLLPDEDTVKSFHASLEKRRNGWYAHRADFPVFQHETFQYYFVPIADAMKSITISRQNDISETGQPSIITVHFYPFQTLPPLSSHLHPKFVVLEAGRKLEKLRDLLISLSPTSQEAARGVEVLLDDLKARWPMIEQIEHIYEAWMRPPNLSHMLANPSFNLSLVPCSDDSSVSFDSQGTPPRRSRTFFHP